MCYAPEQDKPFNTKHIITIMGHTLSVALFYIKGKKVKAKQSHYRHFIYTQTFSNTSYNLTALDYITRFCIRTHLKKHRGNKKQESRDFLL
jgi:hypothetical protein